MILRRIDPAKVRRSVDIVAVIARDVDLTAAGQSAYHGVCPFHDDSSPSLSVDRDKQVYYCFGCGATGDVFTYIQKSQGVSFADALKYLKRNRGLFSNVSGYLNIQNKHNLTRMTSQRVARRMRRLVPATWRLPVRPQAPVSVSGFFIQAHGPLQTSAALARDWADSLLDRAMTGTLAYEDYLHEERELRKFLRHNAL